MNYLNLTKTEADQLLDMRRDLVKLNLEKFNLTSQPARVGFVFDDSGSMEHLFNNGTVQAILEKIFPIALNFDDNGAADSWLFSNGFTRLGEITKDNYYNYVQKEIIPRASWGGTKYAPVMNDVMNKYLVEEPQSIPDYIVFITDGENMDRAAATESITKASKYPIFWQFVGIGNENFKFLKSLDEMEGRYIDNANFFSMSAKDFYSNDEVYNLMLKEYPSWLNNEKVKNMIKTNYSMAKEEIVKPKKKFFGLF